MIEVKGLTKRYGNHDAVKNLSFTVESGTVYGFLGPNGAGKSTTMNILTGCLAATEGMVTVDGLDIFEQSVQAKKKIGYLPELPPLYQDMTAEEYLFFVARAKGLKRAAADAALEKVIEITGLQEMRGRLIRNLSKGYRQRVGIAQALLGDPEYIILDEPTVGLDPRQIIEIRELIRTLGEKHTVILSSHILTEVQACCDRVLIINRGELVAADTPENLEQRFAGAGVYQVTVKGAAQEVLSVLETIDGIDSVQTEETDGRCSAEITAQPGFADREEAIAIALAEAGLPVLHLESRRASLEDVFLGLTTDDPSALPLAAETAAEEDSAAESQPEQIPAAEPVADEEPSDTEEVRE